MTSLNVSDLIAPTGGFCKMYALPSVGRLIVFVVDVVARDRHVTSSPDYIALKIFGHDELSKDVMSLCSVPTAFGLSDMADQQSRDNSAIDVDMSAPFNYTSYCIVLASVTTMRSSGIASLLLATALMTSAAARKDFTVDDLISAPRPQPPIPDAQGTQAISVVDQWSPEHDK